MQQWHVLGTSPCVSSKFSAALWLEAFDPSSAAAAAIQFACSCQRHGGPRRRQKKRGSNRTAAEVPGSIRGRVWRCASGMPSELESARKRVRGVDSRMTAHPSGNLSGALDSRHVPCQISCPSPRVFVPSKGFVHPSNTIRMHIVSNMCTCITQACHTNMLTRQDTTRHDKTRKAQPQTRGCACMQTDDAVLGKRLGQEAAL